MEEAKAANGGAVELRVAGGESAQADLLAAMVRNGYRVTSFRAVGSPLERLYLEHIKESDHL